VAETSAPASWQRGHLNLGWRAGGGAGRRAADPPGSGSAGDPGPQLPFRTCRPALSRWLGCKAESSDRPRGCIEARSTGASVKAETRIPWS